jgi:hypothetical protein
MVSIFLCLKYYQKHLGIYKNDKFMVFVSLNFMKLM